jgi:hypothetical protein
MQLKTRPLETHLQRCVCKNASVDVNVSNASADALKRNATKDLPVMNESKNMFARNATKEVAETFAF